MSGLRLVALDGDPTDEMRQVATDARGFADAVDAGLKAEETLVLSIIEGKVEIACFGEPPALAMALGILELAKDKMIRDACPE